MSSFQHTVQSIQRTRIVLVAGAALSVLALTIVLIATSGSSPSRPAGPGSATSQPTQAELQSQLSAAAGPHYRGPRQGR